MSDKPTTASSVVTFKEWWGRNRWCDREKGEYVWQAAQAAMKERCARVCDEIEANATPSEAYLDGTAGECAEAIRAIGEGDD